MKVNTIFVKDGLAERVEAEGDKSPADVLMTVDIGNLIDLVDKKLTQPVKSATLDAAVPANLRGSQRRMVLALACAPALLYAAKDLDLSSFHLRKSGRSEMEGQSLHPLGSASLQHGDDCAPTWPITARRRQRNG